MSRYKVRSYACLRGRQANAFVCVTLRLPAFSDWALRCAGTPCASPQRAGGKGDTALQLGDKASGTTATRTQLHLDRFVQMWLANLPARIVHDLPAL